MRSTTQPPGKLLTHFVAKSRKECILIAPYIQRGAFDILLRYLPDETPLTVLTRWLPSDLLSGVSDPSIWLSLNNRSATKLLLRSDLHAKLYRCDNTSLIGSANLTGAALGWSKNPNAELLWPLSPIPNEILTLENKWINAATTANQELYEWAQELANQARKNDEINFFELNSYIQFWWPSLRNPEDLWAHYTGVDLPPSSTSAAQADLEALAIPEGLSKKIFERSIRASLIQTPAYSWVNSYIIKSGRFGAMRAALTWKLKKEEINRSATEAWQTMIRWLLHFLPDHYAYDQPRYSEILRLVRNDHSTNN